MKKLFLGALAIATMVACAKEDVISQNNEAIGFKQAFVDNSVRSVVDPSFSNTNLFSSFAVYGTVENAPLFNKVEVTGSGLEDTGSWTYEGTQYWIAGAKYNFAAIAPYAKGVAGAFSVVKNSATGAGQPTFVGKTNLNDYVNDDTDLLYAQSTEIPGQLSGNQKVAFTFRHTLSKVKFSFENAYNASNATIAVRDIKIANAYNLADVELTATTTAWSNPEGSKSIFFGDVTLDTASGDYDDATTDVQKPAEVKYAYNNTYESFYERLIIPTVDALTKKTYQIEFTVDLYVNNVLVASYDRTVANGKNATVEFAPQPGCSYDIAAKITATNIDPTHAQEPIQFTVTTITGWDESNKDQNANVPEVYTDYQGE